MKVVEMTKRMKAPNNSQPKPVGGYFVGQCLIDRLIPTDVTTPLIVQAYHSHDTYICEFVTKPILASRP